MSSFSLTTVQTGALEGAGWRDVSLRDRDAILFRHGLALNIEQWRGRLQAVIYPRDQQAVFEGRGSRARASAHVLRIFEEHAGYLAEIGIKLRRVAVWMSRGAIVAGGYEQVPHDSTGKIDWTIQ